MKKMVLSKISMKALLIIVFSTLFGGLLLGIVFFLFSLVYFSIFGYGSFIGGEEFLLEWIAEFSMMLGFIIFILIGIFSIVKRTELW